MEVSVTRNGLLQKRQTKEGLVYRTYYDGRGRPIKTTDPRTDTSTTARIGYVTNSDRIAWRQDSAGNQTNFGYEAATGRLSTETDPLGKVARYDYTSRGERYRTWGDTAYPVQFGFNDYGEQTTMSTYRTGTGWTGTTWSSSPGTADTTSLAYDPASGTLTSKTDAAGKVVGYTYNTRGQLKTRSWARGVTTTYTYSATTAEQTGIDYSDTTPDLVYTYNRLGQNLTIGDITGTRTFNYSATTTQLTREDLGAFMGIRSVAYQYDTTGTGTKGRLTLFGVGPTATPTSEYGITYGYDTYGRMNQVWNFNYTYLANSNLIASIADSQNGYLQNRTYESNRDLLDVIETKWSGTTKARFDYASDALGRRTGVAKTGEMFSRYSSSGLDTAWGYNDRSEVTSEVSKLGGTSTVLTGRNDAYSFDNIGNRASTAGTTHNGNAAGYTTNALNQYTQRTVPGVIDVAGVAPAAATVSVNGSSTGVTRHNDYYFLAYGATNTSTSVWQSLNITSSLGGSSTRFSFLPLTPEPFTYDLDGNMTSDGRWDYTYDAENRLVSMQTHTTLSPSILPNADARRVEFTNDYLGRRVRKKVLSGYNGTSFATTLSDTKSLYNGWNLIWELDAGTMTKTRACIWGLDWSGTLQGAGGVGGLLYHNDIAGGATMAPAYDGNGNLMAMLKRSDSTGSMIAAYEYDAFGNTLAAYGANAAANPFRFSTKYTDTETGLIYYGLRYYSPTLGRFINRDPIGEQGGANLYAFVQNNAINRWDYLGLHVDPPEGWDSWDDYNSYVQSTMPTPQTESGWNWFYEGPSVFSEALAPTISYDRAQMLYGGQGVAINGGSTLLLDARSGTLLGTSAGPSGGVVAGLVNLTSNSSAAVRAVIASMEPEYGGPIDEMAEANTKTIYAGIRVNGLGMGPEFDDGKAAVLNFASALEHPLSPFSTISGIPNPVGDITEKIEATKLVFDTATSSPSSGGSVTNSARNFLDNVQNILNKRGPFEAYTVVQTARYQEVPFFLFWTRNEWVASKPVYTPVPGPLLGGYFAGPESAANAAKAALKEQLDPH